MGYIIFSIYMHYYFFADYQDDSINTNIIYTITTIFLHTDEGDDVIKIMKREFILILGVFLLSMAFCGAVAAHPGHGTPIEEPSDPETDPGSGGSSSSGSSQASSSPSYTSSSSGSYYYDYDSTSGVTQSDDTGTTDTPTTDNTATQNENAPEEVFDTSEASDSAAGPVAMIGLMVVIGLIAMSFPYKEGGTLRNLQMSLFNR